jgi:hypothetical protein
LISARLIATPVQSPKEIDTVFAELAREPAVGLMMVPDIWLAANREQVVGLAARHRLPAIYGSRWIAAPDPKRTSTSS